ncbi:MAG: hypothetical protein JXB17_09920 [Bacteroidales bacterium]|nr:hypothetical protein [Bacteroidales bacterium]
MSSITIKSLDQPINWHYNPIHPSLNEKLNKDSDGYIVNPLYERPFFKELWKKGQDGFITNPAYEKPSIISQESLQSIFEDFKKRYFATIRIWDAYTTFNLPCYAFLTLTILSPTSLFAAPAYLTCLLTFATIGSSIVPLLSLKKAVTIATKDSYNKLMSTPEGIKLLNKFYSTNR